MFDTKTALAMFAAAVLLSPLLIAAENLLEISPVQASAGTYKLGDEVRFKVKNNAPIAHKITKITAGDADISGCVGEPVEAGKSCEFTVTINSYGKFRVEVESENGQYRFYTPDEYVAAIRFGSFNLSFDRGTYEELKEQMLMEQPDQDVLIEKYRDGSASEAEIEQAKAILQIRNVAEIIQRTNPDVFVLAEFNNDGIGTDMDALNGFQTNYLSQQQKEEVETVTYGHKKNVSTNTGKDSTFDLNNDGKTGEADDAWGFGGYHGQYAFAVFSKYPFDDTKYRTFQNFKWRDMPGEFNPLIEKCDDTNKIPDDKVCGDAWYSKEAWELFPVSSKNHIDLPVSIPETKNSDTPVHFLVSHPTPPIFDSVALRNYKRNRAEVQFWSEYIEGRGYFVDDGGADRGLEEGAHFVIAGDLNADPEVGDGDRPTIEALLKHTLVNTEATIGANKPTSSGAQAFLGSSACSRNCDRSNGSVVTQTSGMRLDYVIPSASLSVLRSGVFWPAPGEPGYNLVYDKDLGVGKEVSSDHRMVWMDLYPTNN